MKNKRILVVEDSPFTQTVIRKILDTLDCKTDIIASGAIAIEAITENNYDLILLDCQLPILSGYEVASEIRDREKKGIINHKNIIIACTANSMEGDRQRCLDAGMDDHVIKPITSSIISSIFSRWLGVRQS
jgi:CheY-like chemotaxis protein